MPEEEYPRFVSELVQYVSQNRITLEVCLTSNLMVSEPVAPRPRPGGAASDSRGHYCRPFQSWTTTFATTSFAT